MRTGALSPVRREDTQLKLNTQPMRTDMTDREAASIIGGIIGCLCTTMADVETVRRAVRWWAETDGAWAHFAEMKTALDPRHRWINPAREDSK